jgi:aryl-alcohol dehydrogenase-like predicted oxidoreductase
MSVKTGESRRLGNVGDRSVPRIGLGCMGMSEFYGARDEAASLRALSEAFELGYRHFDTADMYGAGHNEELLAKFVSRLGARRREILLATKAGIRRPAGGTTVTIDSSPEYIRQACDASLARLGVEQIDLFYLHRRDPAVPIEDSVGAMADLVRAGKAARIGLSEVSAATLERACAVAPIAALQSEYSLWSREIEREVLPACEARGIALVAYSPLGRGFLTGAITPALLASQADLRNHLPRFQGPNFEANRALLPTIAEIATQTGSTQATVALAWVLARSGAIHAIPGARSSPHLRSNLAALDLALDTAQIDRLSAAFASDRVQGDRYPAHLARTVNT